MVTFRAFLLGSLLVPLAIGSVRGRGNVDKQQVKSLNVVEPLKFDQRLLLCNAYPTTQPVTVSKNSYPILAGTNGLATNQCRFVPTGVLSKDKLDFELEAAGVHGTFEVGDLPDNDAVLLLVLQRRDAKSPLIAFQSFAFPMNSESDEAHVAVIDASVGAPSARLKVVDIPHLKGREARSEELSFDRIYSLEAGEYKVAIFSPDVDEKQKRDVEKKTETTVELKGKHDYVMLRTGTGEEQMLLPFPKEPLPAPSAAAPGAGVAAVVFLAAALLAASA